MDYRPKLHNREEEEVWERGQVAGFVRFFKFLNNLQHHLGHSRRGSTDSLASRFSSVTSKESLLVSGMREREERGSCVWCDMKCI